MFRRRFSWSPFLLQFHTMPLLRYGVNSSLELDLAEGVLLAACGDPPGEPLEDAAAAMARALAEPLEYPALRQMTTPGDRVVVALDHGLPQAVELASAVVESLVEAGVEADGITVLRTRADVETEDQADFDRLPPPLMDRISLLAHDPTNRDQLAYLAATDAGDPIMLNRALHDADLVLPVGFLHSGAAAGYYGVHTAIYPTFSDQRTIERFRSLGTLDEASSHRKTLVDEADQVGWLLGINFTIQVVPAAGDRVLHVVAGQSDAVRRRGRDLYRQAWSRPVPRRVSLVVATIEGGPAQQTWENLGRTLATAARLIEEGGSIAVCCELDEALGPAMQRLVGAQSRQTALRRIRKDRPVDALPAAQLADALDHGKVYLLSRLDPADVEELDMVPLDTSDELTRLARQHSSCILLSNASHAIVQIEP